MRNCRLIQSVSETPYFIFVNKQQVKIFAVHTQCVRADRNQSIEKSVYLTANKFTGRILQIKGKPDKYSKINCSSFTDIGVCTEFLHFSHLQILVYIWNFFTFPIYRNWCIYGISLCPFTDIGVCIEFHFAHLTIS